MEVKELTGARYVLWLFGGATALAPLLDRSRVQLQKWKMPSSKGGLDNRVPHNLVPRLREIAADQGKELDLRRVYGIPIGLDQNEPG